MQCTLHNPSIGRETALHDVADNRVLRKIQFKIPDPPAASKTRVLSNVVMAKIPLKSIGDPNLRTLLAIAANASGEVDAADVAIEVNCVLRRHFEYPAEGCWQVGIGVRRHDAPRLNLAETIAQVARVGEEIARAIADTIIASHNADRFHNPVRGCINRTERQAAFASFWRDFTAAALHCGPCGSEQCNTWMGTLFSWVEQHARSALCEIATGTKIYRARYWCDDFFHGQLRTDLATALGPPPAADARPNRANPARMGCFYGAGDVETCLSELRLASGWIVVTGEFELQRPMKALDLRQLEAVPSPSVFADGYKTAALEIGLLRGISREFSEPSWPGSEEVHYVATQYFAEYCRCFERERVDGIIYPSTQRPGGSNYALFADRELLGAHGAMKLQDAFSMRVASTTVRTEAVDLCITDVTPRAIGTNSCDHESRSIGPNKPRHIR